MEITTTNTNELVINLIQEEKKLKDRLKEIKEVKDFYSEEIEAIKHLYHGTRTGEIILITSMSDEHIINTAVMFSDYLKESNYKKYADEIKKRNLTKEYFAKLKLKLDNDYVDDLIEGYYSEDY